MNRYQNKALVKATTISWGSTFGTAVVCVPLMGWWSLFPLAVVSGVSTAYLTRKTKKIVTP